ncbi:hypothetical protein ACWGUL_23570, partial [Streptomyces albidoflavus]
MERESGGIGRRRLLGLTGAGLGALAASGLLAACAPPRREEDGGGQGGASPEKVTLALPSSLSSLDVGRESGTLNYAVACLVQEGLLSVSPDGELRPGLAARWTQPDERTYVFTLRRGPSAARHTSTAVPMPTRRRPCCWPASPVSSRI